MTPRVRVNRVQGAPYSLHEIVAPLPAGGSVTVHAQLQPYGEGEVEERYQTWLRNEPPPQMRPFHAKPGPKPRGFNAGNPLPEDA